MSNPIKIVLADDSAVFRWCLRELLADHADLQVIGEADDGQQAVDLALGLKPDVVLMDIRMPVLTGIEATRRIRAIAPEINVVVLTACDELPYRLALRQAGAAAYMLKTAEGDVILSAIREVCQMKKSSVSEALPDPNPDGRRP